MWRDVASEPGYWPTLIGEAVTGVQTIYDEYEDIGRHRQDRFVLRVPTGRLAPHTVDYKICEITLEGRPAPEWGCYLRLGSLVEVTLGSLAQVPVDDLGFLRPDEQRVFTPVSVRVFVPDEEA